MFIFILSFRTFSKPATSLKYPDSSPGLLDDCLLGFSSSNPWTGVNARLELSPDVKPLLAF